MIKLTTCDSNTTLEITNLYNGTILSTFNVNSRDFSFNFFKMLRTNENNIFLSIIILKMRSRIFMFFFFFFCRVKKNYMILGMIN